MLMWLELGSKSIASSLKSTPDLRLQTSEDSLLTCVGCMMLLQGQRCVQNTAANTCDGGHMRLMMKAETLAASVLLRSLNVCMAVTACGRLCMLWYGCMPAATGTAGLSACTNITTASCSHMTHVSSASCKAIPIVFTVAQVCLQVLGIWSCIHCRKISHTTRSVPAALVQQETVSKHLKCLDLQLLSLCSQHRLGHCMMRSVCQTQECSVILVTYG